MDLQTLFYITGIVFMLVVLVLMIGIGIATVLLIQKVHEVIAIVSKQAKAIMYVVSHPGDIAQDLGATVVKTVVRKAQQTVRGFRKTAASKPQ